jgi:predicted nucleotide-binding protein
MNTDSDKNDTCKLDNEIYYHVVIKTVSDPSNEEREVNLSKERVYEQFVDPYETGEPLFINGKTMEFNNIQRIKAFSSKQQRSQAQFPPDIENYMSYYGYGLTDVTTQFFKRAYGCRKVNSQVTQMNPGIKSKKIFVVHGHGNEMLHYVARILFLLDLKPIILREQANQGKTIIEKFEEIADGASFAVVLASPDDLCYEKDQKPDTAMFRARQNVILELGFFIGKLGRSNVVTLIKTDKNFEFPSDYGGIVHLLYDDHGNWRFDLVRELRAAGYDVNANKLIDME